MSPDVAAIEASLVRGPDGWTSTQVYIRAYEVWVAQGKAAEDFLRTFPPTKFINPSPYNDRSELLQKLARPEQDGAAPWPGDVSDIADSN